MSNGDQLDAKVIKVEMSRASSEFQDSTLKDAELVRICRKVDFRLIPLVITIFVLNFLNRVNIGYARLYHLEADLNLSQAEYSWSLSIFFIGYILFEVPSNLMLKKVKASKWVARIMITWGIISASMAAVHNFPGMLAARFMLGVAEAGLGPALVFYLSSWYTRKQLGIRIAYFMSSSSLSAIIAGPLAYGLSKMDGLGRLSAWQWIFIMEGVPSIIFGFAVFWLMPNSPSDVKWLTSQEQTFLLKQLANDQIDLDDGKINWKQVKEAFTDFKVYMHMLIGFLCACPFYAIMQLLPTIINNMGFNTSQTMLLTIPPYVASATLSILISWLSDLKRERGLYLIPPLAISFIGYLTLCFVENQIGGYIVLILAAVGAIAALPINLTWLNNNMVGGTKSATANAMVISFTNIGGIIAGQMYRYTEAPHYLPSNLISLSCLLGVVIISLVLRYWLRRENARLENQPNSTVDSHSFRYTL